MDRRGLTYFAAMPRWAVAAVLLAALCLVGVSTLAPAPRAASHGGFDDKSLYRAVTSRVISGEDYYAAASQEHRAHHYPTSPAQVFREPTLIWMMSALRPEPARRGAMLALCVVAVLALDTALVRNSLTGGMPALVRLALLFTGLIACWWRDSPFMHECWAGLLIALSLGLYRPGAWGWSLALAFLACLFRETALPFLGVMLLFALIERRAAEAWAWAIAAAVFCLLFALHLSLASGLSAPGDRVSPGWVVFGGWPFLLEAARRNLLLILSPRPVVAVGFLVGLIGLAGRRDPWASRAALTVAGYSAAFLVVGRADNAYWGILFAPLLPIGFILCPAAFLDMGRVLIGAPRRGSDSDQPADLRAG
jgi:hypothetical protein